MRLRVGIDLVLVDSIREALDLHGDRYLERVYTAQEIADCRDGDDVAPERLAARFAAKEAGMKALRLSRTKGSTGVRWSWSASPRAGRGCGSRAEPRSSPARKT